MPWKQLKISVGDNKLCAVLETGETTHPFSSVLPYHSIFYHSNVTEDRSQRINKTTIFLFGLVWKFYYTFFNLDQKDLAINSQAMCTVYDDCYDTLVFAGKWCVTAELYGLGLSGTFLSLWHSSWITQQCGWALVQSCTPHPERLLLLLRKGFYNMLAMMH